MSPRPAARSKPRARPAPAPAGAERINAELEQHARPITELHEDPDNVRVHSERNLRAIADSLTGFGQQRAIVALEDGTVIAGNGTLAAARSLGWRRIAVITFPDREAARAFAIADNRTGELASWSADGLVTALDELELQGWGADGLGFSEADKRRLRRSRHAEEDAAPALPKKASRKAGELWLLGEHRVLCGDATDPATIARLMAGERASLVFTDPPYGVDYQAQSGKHEAIAGDDLTRDKLTDLLTPALKLAVESTTDDAAFYIWHAHTTREDFAWSMRAAGLEELQYLVWVKPSITMGWSDYKWAHEPCFYAGKMGSRPPFYANRDEGTVWRIEARTGDGRRATLIGPGVVLSGGDGHELYIAPRAPKRRLRHVRLNPGDTIQLQQASGSDVWEAGRDEKPDHPTQKPVELATRAIENSSRRGEVVLDPFLGSGSTLIGAEQTGRRCFGTELDPRYVDVICQRWEAYSGQKAERA